MSDLPQAQAPLAPPSHHTKNIVICCDGTGNEFGDANSNVVKLYTALTINNEQVGYYHPGVGTMGDPTERYAIPRWWSQVRGLAFAAGFKNNVLDAYRYLMEVYNDHDQVYLIGFSRGAYTARALAGLLNGYGLLCKGNEGHLPYAWRLYADQHLDRTRRTIDQNLGSASDTTIGSASAFQETFCHDNFSIRFVGLWDTVSSVGWISTPLRLFNVAQNPSIQIGRHAVSIDERRCFYVDNLWGDPLPGQDILQVWFPGVHSDVGGSYSQSTSGLSNVTLGWMLKEAEAAGLLLDSERFAMLFGTPSSKYPEASKLYPIPTYTTVHASLTLVWWILELLPHLYYFKDSEAEMRRIPLGAWRQLPFDAIVHHSAFDRMSDPAANYHPQNLDRDSLVPDLSLPTLPVSGQPGFYLWKPKTPVKANNLTRIAKLIFFIAFDIVAAILILMLLAALGLLAWCYVLVPLYHVAQCVFSALWRWIVRPK